MIIIAHNIRSLHNVGAIFRSSDAFSVEKLYLTGYTGQPPRKEIAKTALGSQNRVAWEHVEDVSELIVQLKQNGYHIAALETGEGAVSIDDVSEEKPIALVLGNEVEGIDAPTKSACDVILEIPMPGAKQSLNVSVATGIALFALSQKNK